MKSAVILFGLISVLALSNAKTGFGPGEQDWGYVNVREGAHMFWWLHHTMANVSDSTQKPLIIWLQGGPGGSSCGYGNFEIIGPWDLDLQPRNFSWVNDFNVLFIDNPVGTGYSYVERSTQYATDNLQVARDMVVLLQSFYAQLPQFKSVPLYIVGQSYGGKMAADIALLLWKEQQAGNIESNVKGFAMGNAWIHPVEATLAWGPLLYRTSYIDMNGLNNIMAAANRTRDVFDSGDYFGATNQWRNTQGVVMRESDGVDFYNILNKERVYFNRAEDIPIDISLRNTKADRSLDSLMNGVVKEALNIPSNVRWGSQSSAVFAAMNVDFMKPVVSVVEEILNTTPLQAVVYNGNVDLICDTAGQKRWTDNMEWSRESQYRSAARQSMWINGLREGYRRTGGGFAFFWVNVAGHSAPADNPPALREVLRYMTGV